MIELSRMAKRSLRLEIPEPMQLPDPLIDEILDIGFLAGDGEVDIPCVSHQNRRLPRSFIKHLAMHRVPRGREIRGWRLSRELGLWSL